MERRASRLVLCVRVQAKTPEGTPALLDALRTLDGQAIERGGVLVAWGASRVAYAFAPGDVDVAVSLASFAVTTGVTVAAGLAEGDLSPLAEDGSRGTLAWGRPLAVASALASAARAGEVVCATDLGAVRSGMLLPLGRARARAVGEVVVGVRVGLDEPFRDAAALQVSGLRVPPLVGAPDARVPLEAGAVTFLRVDRGFGGTRLLETLAARAPRTLHVMPSGAGLAPLGAVRRAVERSITHDLGPKLVALAEPLDALLSGEALDADTVASLVDAFFATRGSRHDGATAPSLVVVDDADLVDAASLEACARAMQRAARDGVPLAMIARLPRGARGEGLPPSLSTLPRAGEVDVGPLGPAEAQEIALAMASGALDEPAAVRWAALAGGSPLGVVEAVTSGVARGLLVWTGGSADEAEPLRLRDRTRLASRGPARPAAHWIRARAGGLSPNAQLVLAVVAMFGGEAKQARLARVLEDVLDDSAFELEPVVEALVREKWLLDVHEDWLGLPSRTHRDVAEGLLEGERRRAVHGALAAMLRAEEGSFGRAEAAWHAAAEGDAARASRGALEVARAAASRGLEASVTALVAFARRTDPTCEETAREVLALALTKSAREAVAPSRPAVARGTASEKLLAAVPASPDERPSGPDVTRPVTPALPFTPVALPLSMAPPAGARGSEVAEKIGELARDALLHPDGGRLEQVLDGIEAERPILTERMRALARVGRGEVGDALRVLRRMRESLPAGEHAMRCQASLALGVALSVGGRPAEALLEGLDALARAREAGDAKGARACLAFLAKLYASVGRTDAAARLGAAG